MKPFEKSVQTLEYDKILSLLAGCCTVEAGKEKILTLRPEADLQRVVFLQKETAVAKKISAVKGAPSLSAFSQADKMTLLIFSTAKTFTFGFLLASSNANCPFPHPISIHRGLLLP